MNETVKKILEIFKDLKVLTVLESPTNYIVTVCDTDVDPNEAIDSSFAVDKTTFKSSEFSYFDNPDEYAEACDNVLYKHDEITHHGIKGMKWGIRRYQNKDGTLTAKGKKRYNEELAKVRQQEKVVKNKTAVKNRLDKLAARKKAVADKEKELEPDKKKGLFKKSSGESKTDDPNAAQPKKKKMSEMSDEELANAIRRVQMEKQYKDLTTEDKVAKGDGFTKKFMKESVEPAVIDAGKSLIRDKLLDVGRKKLGLSEKAAGKTMEDLNKEMKELEIRQLREKLDGTAKKAAAQTAQTTAAKEHKQTVNEFKNNPTGKATPLSTSSGTSKTTSKPEKAGYDYRSVAISTNKSFYNPGNISKGESHVSSSSNKPLSSISNSTVESGSSFVGRYDRAAIAAMDDE